MNASLTVDKLSTVDKLPCRGHIVQIISNQYDVTDHKTRMIRNLWCFLRAQIFRVYHAKQHENRPSSDTIPRETMDRQPTLKFDFISYSNYESFFKPIHATIKVIPNCNMLDTAYLPNKKLGLQPKVGLWFVAKRVKMPFTYSSKGLWSHFIDHKHDNIRCVFRKSTN